MSGIEIDIDIEAPRPPNRDEQKRMRFDAIMDKMDYCSDLVLADINRSCALKPIRQVWHWLESTNPLPDYLYPIKQFIAPIIKRFGADNYDSADADNANINNSDEETDAED